MPPCPSPARFDVIPEDFDLPPRIRKDFQETLAVFLQIDLPNASIRNGCRESGGLPTG
jgi:hypothetical protein